MLLTKKTSGFGKQGNCLDRIRRIQYIFTRLWLNLQAMQSGVFLNTVPGDRLVEVCPRVHARNRIWFLISLCAR